MNYTKREVIRRLKQYDMFLDSLNLATDPVQKERICDQLDKIEKQILLETNSEYEEEYMLLLGKNTNFFDEEKTRLRDLISLIIERRQYLEARKARHKKITGSLVELTTFLGEDKLNDFRKRLKIIEKYEENKERQEKLIKEIKDLDKKISEASRNVKANMRLNDSLENKMIDMIDEVLNRFGYYKLTEEKDEITEKYSTLEYALHLAKDNLKNAKELRDQTAILECDSQLSEITIEYSNYNEKINILRLIEVFDKPVDNYDELLSKREKIDSILKKIVGSTLYSEISEELNKQYNTIKLEGQDIKTYESLKEERDRKNRILYEIEEENNSREFKIVLEDLIRNEKRTREEKIKEARRQEYQERQKKLIEEQKIETARVKRQKLIEEARFKDQLQRTEKLKELQEKTVISPKKESILPTRTQEEPKENKLFESIVSSGGDFDTDELFENTKIVPNQVSSSSENTQPKDEDPANRPLDKSSTIGSSSIQTDNSPSFDFIKDDEPSVIDLFKEEASKREAKVEDEEEDAPTSIYDILENNKNIIWKSTDTKTSGDTIPVISNNNLKPEILEEKKASNIEFPDLGSKEGEILWKETL